MSDQPVFRDLSIEDLATYLHQHKVPRLLSVTSVGTSVVDPILEFRPPRDMTLDEAMHYTGVHASTTMVEWVRDVGLNRLQALVLDGKRKDYRAIIDLGHDFDFRYIINEVMDPESHHKEYLSHESVARLVEDRAGALSEALGRISLINTRIEDLKEQMGEAVEFSRALGGTWAQIGEASGVTAQSAQRRWTPTSKDKARVAQNRRRSEGASPRSSA